MKGGHNHLPHGNEIQVMFEESKTELFVTL